MGQLTGGIAHDFNNMLTVMTELIRSSLGSGTQLGTILASGPWRTRVDQNQLENVLLNLAVNARDAMPEGGRLTIETQMVDLNARYAAAQMIEVVTVRVPQPVASISAPFTLHLPINPDCGE